MSQKLEAARTTLLDQYPAVEGKVYEYPDGLMPVAVPCPQVEGYDPPHTQRTIITNNIHYIEGDLAMFPRAQMIVQQVNAMSMTSRGLSAQLEHKHGAPFWTGREMSKDVKNLATIETRPKPGSVQVVKSKLLDQYIAHLVAQEMPGNLDFTFPKWRENVSGRVETYDDRLYWFDKCLDALGDKMRELKLKTVAFPYQIGCGLAGGSWEQYRTRIEQWSIDYTRGGMFRVYIVVYRQHLEDAPAQMCYE